MKNLRLLVLLAVSGLLFAACQTEIRTSPFQPSPFSGSGTSPETPPNERVASLLQEAKQQYDDGKFDAAHRYAESAVRVIEDYDLDRDNISLAYTIQAFSLLQLGRYDNYYVKSYGTVPGAVTKFNKALEANPDSMRAKLGLGLVRSRRHSESIDKAAKIAQGSLLLELIRDGIKRGFADPESEENVELLSETKARLTKFITGRQGLIKLGYIFRHPASAKFSKKGMREEAPWLGTINEGTEQVELDEIGWSLDDAIAYEASETELDLKATLARLDKIRSSWTHVRFYWRHEALEDLQVARDRLLEVRKISPDYFWVDRDLAVVFESTGAFFLDIGLEIARNKAIAAGTKVARLAARAEKIYLGKRFSHISKRNSRENYAAAVTYLDSFARKHAKFELLRQDAVKVAQANEPEDDPFTVDLVIRYTRTMNNLITEERSLRQAIILEAAALVIDPLFQIDDLKKANIYASRLQALDPDDPVHHFVRATAYHVGEKWQDSKRTYEAFLRDSSIVQHRVQREIARTRLEECENELNKAARESSG